MNFSQSDLALEDFLHPLRRFTLKLRHHVAMSVHSQADLKVTQDFHHHAWRYALHQEERCARMPKVMKADLA
jgi:hypothetical protein